MGSWEETGLWQLLQGRPDEDEVSRDARETLSRCMPEISSVLASAATSPADFTLHDQEHSFRVAQRMLDVCPEPTHAVLSGFEIALLLLSAYLHDIGMSPDRGLVLGHYKYVLSGDGVEMSDVDRASFQAWLDEHARAAILPLAQTMPMSAAISTALQLVTHYCRDRHVEWSDRWIESNLSGLKMGVYAAWVADLRRLCASHHEGLTTLVEDAFDARVVATDTVVNLRYLCCLLRIADVIEFDPERTPDVVLRQRAVSPASVIYWHKDHEIAMTLSPAKLLISARPTSAILHKAIADTANHVDAELRICRDLFDRGTLNVCPGKGALEHEWHLPASCFRDIAARDGLYEYIDGAFRPDTDRILELLAGVGLYGNPLTAIRELIQNAADAVSEQIAWARLEWDDPNDPVRVKALQDVSSIDLTIAHRDDSYWLDCHDTGVGMTKAIITDHVLVGGSTRKREIMEQQRLCSDAGFHMQRSGRFGIGVLSYFMIASQMIIRTERSNESKTPEGNAWEFSSNGLDAFGELRRTDPKGHGSNVSLLLRDEIVGVSIESFTRRLKRYLEELLVWLPCVLRLDILGEQTAYGPNWCRAEDRVKVRTLPRSSGNLSDLPTYLSENQRREAEREATMTAELEREILDAMKFVQIEGELDGHLGSYRANIPYFLVTDDPCFAYMRAQVVDGVTVVGSLRGKDIFTPTAARITSWNGMAIDVKADPYLTGGMSPCIVEIDFRGDGAGQLEVSRNALRLTSAGENAMDEVKQIIRRKMQALAKEWSSSQYRWLNDQLAHVSSSSLSTLRWLKVDPQGSRTWSSISIPATYEDNMGVQEALTARIKANPISIVQSLSNMSGFPRETTWYPRTAGPNRLVLLDGDFPVVVPIWESDRADAIHPLGDTATFPPEWSEFVRFIGECEGHPKAVWNSDHPLVCAVTLDGYEWCARYLPEGDPLGAAEEMLKDRSRAAAWLCSIMASENEQLWDGLWERDADFCERLWRILFFLKDEPRKTWPHVKALTTYLPGEGLIDIRPGEWIQTDLYELSDEALPRPTDANWNLTVESP